MPDKNHMSRAQAQELDRLLNLSPTKWENKVQAAIVANGWKFWRDKDRPTNNKKILGTRMPGHPDFEAWKRFESTPPKALMKVLGVFKAKWTPRLYIECKTGRGVMDDKQREFYDSANDNPGCVALCVYPSDYYNLVEMLGGIFPEENSKVVDINKRRKK